MKFIFSNKINKETQGLKAFNFNGLSLDLDDNEFISLKEIYSLYSDIWLNDFLKWHGELNVTSEKVSNSWYFSRASRPLSWQPSILRSFFFVEAISEYLMREKLDSVCIIDAPEEVRLFIKEKFHLAEIRVVGEVQKSQKAPAYILRCFKYLLQLAKRVKFQKKIQEPVGNILVYTDSLGKKDLRRNGDYYFGKELDGYNCQFLYQTRDSKEVELAPSALTIYDLLGFRDIIRISSKFLSYYLEMKRVRKILLPFKSSKLFKDLFIKEMNLNNFPIIEYEIFYATKNLFEKFQFEKLLYPFEDKPLERALLMNFNGGNSYGYAHPVHGPGHLYLKPHAKGVATRPNVILCTGEVVKNWMNESLGFKNVINSGTRKFVSDESSKTVSLKDGLKILILINSPTELYALYNFILDDVEAFSGSELIIRNHPHISLEIYNKMITKIRSKLSGCNVKSNNGALVEQLNWCNLSLFCSTSAGVESMLFQRFTSYIDLNTWVDHNPLSGLPNHNVIPEVNTMEELRELFEVVKKMDLVEYKEKSLEQREFALGIYDKPDFSFLSE